MTLELAGRPLTLEQIDSVAKGVTSVCLAQNAVDRMQASRGVVEDVLARGEVVYGVNTGFGKLADVVIAGSEVDALQLNLVRSHSCGIGMPLSESEVRAKKHDSLAKLDCAS